MQNYIPLLIFFAGGLLGASMHFYFKFTSLRKLSIAASETLTFKTYWNREYPSYICAILTVVLFCFLLRELQTLYPKIAGLIRLISVIVGWMGNRLLQRAMGNTEKNLLAVIDKKTNIADKVVSGDDVTGHDLADLQNAKDLKK